MWSSSHTQFLPSKWRQLAAAVVVVVAMGSASALAQVSNVIAGRVVDDSGRVVVGATVTVETAGGVVRRTTSNERGEFQIADLPDGAATVVVEQRGFARFGRTTPLGPATRVTDITIALRPAPVAEQVTVTERAAPYTDDVTVFGKVAAPLREVPNSVSVLTRQQMDDQNVVTTWDALSQMTGVTAISNDGTQAQYHARGAALENQQDGMPSAMPMSGYQQYDMAIYERVEVLRGPAGLLQGSGNLSGTVNLVRRRPTADRSASVFVSTGQWANHHVEAVVSGPVAGSVRGLAVVAATDRDYFYDRGHDTKWLGYGVVEWRPAAGTSLGFTATHQRDRAKPYSGLPTYTDGQYLEVDRSFNPYPDWNHYEWDTTDVGVDAEHRFSPRWSVTARVNRREQRFMFHDGYPTTGVSRGTYTATYARRESTFDYTSDSVDTFLNGQFSLLGQAQEVLIGVNAAKFSSQGGGVNPNQDPTLTLTNVTVANPPAVSEPTSLVYRTGSLSETSQQGLYTMLRSHVSSRVIAVVGGRWSHYNNRSRAVEPSTPTDWSQGARERGEFTPYAGVVVDVLPQVSAYASYSEIFAPQTQRRVDGSVLDPRVGRQYEIGVKGDHLGGRLLTSLAYFDIRDNNRSYPDPGNTGFFVPLGEVQSAGWETEVTGRVASWWDVTAGYTRLETEYLVHQTLQGQPTSFWYPPDSFKLWSMWRASEGRLSGLRVGVGVQASGPTASGTDTTNAAGEVTVRARRQGSYAVVNANVSYAIRSTVAVTLQANNLFDQTYYTRLGGTNTYNSFGEPRGVMVSLRWSGGGTRATAQP